MKKFHEMLAKKRDMKPSEKHAKMGVLKDLKSSLADSMGDKLDGLKKVSVMSNSPEGMEAGLDKAQMMAKMNPQMMSEGGLANAGMVDSSESYHGFGPMDESAQSMDMNSDEPEHVSYDGSPDAKMGPGYAEGGMVGPNEADASDVTYSGHGEDYGAEHSDSDEEDKAIQSGKDFGAREHDSDQMEHVKYMSKGGKVKSPVEEAAESVDEERSETEADMGDDLEHQHAMSASELQAKIDHLMQLKKQMEQQ